MMTVSCSYDMLEDIYNTFDAMDYKAGEYTPAEEDLKLILENLAEYLPFLLWIDETGIETEENAEIRHSIREIIKTRLNLFENEVEK